MTQIGGRPIIDRVDLERALLGLAAGATIDVAVTRNQAAVTVSIQLAAAPERRSPDAFDQRAPQQ